MSQVLLGPINPDTQKYALIRIAIEKTLEEVGKLIDKVLTNRRRIANEQIKDERSMAHTHTAINHIEDELKKEIGI